MFDKKLIILSFFILLFSLAFTKESNAFVSNSNISIKPNPAKNFFRIKLNNNVDPEEITIIIFDIIGNPLTNYPQSIIDSNTIEINIETLKSGMYIIRVKGPNFLTTERLIVDKN